VYIYGSYRKIKTGVPFFLDHPVEGVDIWHVGADCFKNGQQQQGRPDHWQWTAMYDGQPATVRKQTEGVSWYMHNRAVTEITYMYMYRQIAYLIKWWRYKCWIKCKNNIKYTTN